MLYTHKKIISTVFLTLFVLRLQADNAEDVFQRQIISSCNNLKLNNLFSEKIKSTCVDASRILVGKICANTVATNQALINNACINELQTQDACVSGTLFAPHIITNEPQVHATAVLSGNTTYTLNQNLNFDTILDDPHNNITLNPFVYTAPVTGYYLLSVHIDQSDLILSDPTSVILGAPMASIQLLINNQLARQSLLPFLTFNNQQSSLLSTLLRLNGGDTLRIVYGIQTLSSTGSGVVDGTVNLTGNGTEFNSCVFQIHLLSAARPEHVPALCPLVTCTSDQFVCDPCSTCCECTSYC